MPYIREIGTHSHFPKQHRTIENVIAWRAAAVAPFAIDIGSGVVGANLLAVAIDAAIRDINVASAFGHARLRSGIDVGAVLFHLRIEVADLDIRHEDQTEPGKGERPENSQEKWKQTFHAGTSSGSGSSGFKKVGTLAVRPRPRSISPK